MLHLGDQEAERFGVPAFSPATSHPLVPRQHESGFLNNCSNVAGPPGFQFIQVRTCKLRTYRCVGVIAGKQCSRSGVGSRRYWIRRYPS